MAEYNVIFHIDESTKWRLLIKNVSNLLNALENEIFNIEILANSEAVKYYISNQDPDIINVEDLNKKGVRFVACNNALMAYGIKKPDLLHFVEIVPVGVLELIKKQNEGYAYIKP